MKEEKHSENGYPQKIVKEQAGDMTPGLIVPLFSTPNIWI